MGSCPCRPCCPCCPCCPCPEQVDETTQFPSSTRTSNTERTPPARPQKSIGTSTIPILRKNAATSTVGELGRTPGLSQSPAGPQIKIILKDKINVTSLDQIAQDADFLPIVNAAISLEIDPKKNFPQGASSGNKIHQKKSHNDAWDDKYFIHGELSNIVADVKNELHSCINSSLSEDTDIFFKALNEINIKIAAILKDRLSKISVEEQKYVNQFIQKQEDLIGRILIEGSSYANQYEEHYRELIAEFIKKLELEMSVHLDYLQERIEDEKQSVFQGSCNNIKIVTEKADQARNEVHWRLQEIAAKKREEILEEIARISKNAGGQPLGYEQLRTLNLQVYSTVGLKTDGQGCDNIPERQKFIKEIDHAKPHQPQEKRTVYLKSHFTQQQTNRKNDS